MLQIDCRRHPIGGVPLQSAVYTIGYLGRSIDQFISLLRENSVSAVADIRSTPRSHSPEFNQDSLKASLRGAGIFYVFLGRELGARTPDKACYIAGKVQYDLLAATATFRSGLDRIEKGRSHRRIALMCAEKEPLDCHRCILVGRHLAMRGVPVRHIIDSGLVEDQDSVMRRLIDELRISEACSSQEPEDRLSMAYQIQGRRIAFQSSNNLPKQFDLWK